MQLGSREQAVDAARRATMLKSTFASIRHLLDGNEFMPDQSDANFQLSPAKETVDDDENPFQFIDRQFRKHELALFKESGSEDDSINDFIDPFHTDDFCSSFPAFNPQRSVVTSDQSISDSKGLLSTDDDFGFDEADFESNLCNEAANNSNGSSHSPKDRSSRDRLSKRLNSSTRLRRKPDKSHDIDNVSATENTEISNGSSMKRSVNSSGSGQRRTNKSRNGETETPRDDAFLTSPRAGTRRRKSKSELLTPRKVDSRPTKDDSGSNRSRKSCDKPVNNNTGSIDLLKALAVELMQKSNNGDAVDAAILTDRVVTRVKELQASRLSKESVGRRSRSRLERFDKQDTDEKIRSSSKEKRSRSRSRLKALSSSPAVKLNTKEDSKPTVYALQTDGARLSSNASSEDKQPSKKTTSTRIKDLHPFQSKGFLNEMKSPRAKSRSSKGDLDAPRSPPAELLDEIKSPKAKSRKSKGNFDAPRSPPAELLDEIKSPKAKSRKSKGNLDALRSPPAELLNEIKSPRAKARKTKGDLDPTRSPPVELLNGIKSTKKSLKSKSRSREARSANSSDDEIIDVLAKLINEQLSAKDLISL